MSYSSDQLWPARLPGWGRRPILPCKWLLLQSHGILCLFTRWESFSRGSKEVRFLQEAFHSLVYCMIWLVMCNGHFFHSFHLSTTWPQFSQYALLVRYDYFYYFFPIWVLAADTVWCQVWKTMKMPFEARLQTRCTVALFLLICSMQWCNILGGVKYLIRLMWKKAQKEKK